MFVWFGLRIGLPVGVWAPFHARRYQSQAATLCDRPDNPAGCPKFGSYNRQPLLHPKGRLIRRQTSLISFRSMNRSNGEHVTMQVQVSWPVIARIHVNIGKF